MACISDESEHILLSRIDDTVHLCDKRGAPCFLGFLDLHEQAVVRREQGRFAGYRWNLLGGYPEAERRLLAVYPDYYVVTDEDCPFCMVGFRYRPSRSLTHRDFLGTLLSAGIRRDKIGDILCGEGLSVVVIREEIAPFICEQIDRIGGEGVTVIPDYEGPLPITREYEEIHETIASARLDVAVKALTRLSREKAADLIRLGGVSVDHLPVVSVSAPISAPCTLSIRGIGRFLIDQIGPETKKGRFVFIARKCK